MKTSIVFDSKKLERKLEQIQKQMPAKVDKALVQTSLYGINVITDSASKGYGYKGRFAPYTPEYRERKAEGWSSTPKTRGFGGAGSVGRPNLFLRGEMFGAISAILERRGVAKIYFTRATEAKKAVFNEKKRPFFGFSKDGKDRLRKFFFNRVKI